MELAHLRWDGDGLPTEDALAALLRRDGFTPHAWTDAPGAHYSPHSHDHDECLGVVSGGITFTAAGRAFPLRPGDRLMLPRGTVHTADVGADGATYLIGQKR